MKKRLLIGILVLCALLLVPHVASANSPARSPWMLRVECSNMISGTEIDVVFVGKGGQTRTLKDEYREYSDGTTGYLYPFCESGETAFYLRVMLPDGTERQTDEAKIVDYGCYTYDGETNLLKENGTYYSKSEALGTGALILLYILGIFLVPLALTMLFEFLAALAFRMRPKKYVLIINLITNPIMNLVLVVLTLWLSGGAAYWITLAVLELIVCGLEFLFYTKKYKDRKKWVLLVFTLVANTVSAAAGLLPLWLILL